MNKPLILVVEDDAPVRNLITTTLKANDYRFQTAANGEAGVLATASQNPDIILLDLGLPDMDGMEVIKRVRSWSNVPIIVISARSEDTDKIDALDAGADDYLTKPFSVEELLARLRVTQRRLAVMNGDGAGRESVFTNGRLRIDYGAGCAYLGEGNALNADRVQAALPHGPERGKVLTHTYITQKVWEAAGIMISPPCGYLWQLSRKSWRS